MADEIGLDIRSFGPIGPVSEVNLLADFPYKQAALSVTGSAHFHDFGRFLAAFENQFPHIRVLNLTLDVNPNGMEEPETLSFKMEIVTLVKPNAT